MSSTDSPLSHLPVVEAPPAITTGEPGQGRLLLAAREAAAACGVSVATWWRWAAAGRVPAPVRIGSTVRWRRAELDAWVAQGCPPRQAFELLREPAQRNGRPRGGSRPLT